MVDVNQNINQKMVFLNEEDLAENVKKFPVFYDRSNDEFRRKDRKNASTKVSAIKQPMVPVPPVPGMYLGLPRYLRWSSSL